MNYIQYWETHQRTFKGKVFVNGEMVLEFEVKHKFEIYDIGRKYNIKEYSGFTF